MLLAAVEATCTRGLVLTYNHKYIQSNVKSPDSLMVWGLLAILVLEVRHFYLEM